MVLYILKINTSEKNFQVLNTLFEVDFNDYSSGLWQIEINEKNPKFKNAISFFSQKLLSFKKKLEELKINREDVTIWYLYEFDNQCNMEFSIEEINNIAACGADLCISCWQKNSKIAL